MDATRGRCRAVVEVESWLKSSSLRILGSAPVPNGIQGARILTLSVRIGATETVFRAKWRSFDTTRGEHVPRRELAAYAVQKLFLAPYEYVVPPTAGHCFPLEEYRRRVSASAGASFRGTRCVFGFLSYWLEDALSLDAAESAELFESDRGPLDNRLFWADSDYRRSIAHVNLLTFLIDHDDSHHEQFIVRGGSDRLIVYSVDHSMSLDAPTNPKLDREDDWSWIQVPALPRDKLEKLTELGDRELQSLSVIEQYENREGVLHHVAPTAAVNQGSPVRWVTQEQLQTGLTAVEIAILRGRLAALRDRARRGLYRIF